MEYTFDNHKHNYFTNENGQEECKKCTLLRTTIEGQTKSTEEIREVMRCIVCEYPIRMAYEMFVEEGNNATFYFCDNQKCSRYGLASIVWK